MTDSASSQAPKFSLVVVSYNCLESLKRCLTSVREHSPECECIVVDNASKDGTREYLENYPGPKVLNEGNHGFSRACNQGASLARGQYLVFLNPDTVVTPGWLETMAGYFNLDKVGAVGPTSNYVAGLQKAELYGIPPPMSLESITNIAQTLKEKNQGRGISTRLLIGFCLMIPRRLFEELGGMDEKLFLGNDDLDLSWRLQLKGYRLVVASDAFVYHEGQKSFQSEPNEIVSRLVQESTDALYDKLIRHYGSEDKVPSSQDLWGMSWFHPFKKGSVAGGEPASGKPAGTDSGQNSPGQLSGGGGDASSADTNSEREERPDSLQPKTQSTREDEIRTHLEARTNIQTVVIAHPDWGGAEALSGTVAGLQDDLRKNLICIGHGCSIASTVEFAEGMKLELSAQTPRKTVVEKILSLAEGDHLFLVTGGLEVTPSLQEKISGKTSLPDGCLIPLQRIPPHFNPENRPLACLSPRKVLSRWVAEWPGQDFWRQLQERLPTPANLPALAYVHEQIPPHSGLQASAGSPAQTFNDYPSSENHRDDPACYQEPGDLSGEPGADGDGWPGPDDSVPDSNHFTSIENLPQSLKAYITEARCPLFGSTENEGWMNLQGVSRDPAQGDLYILRVYTDTRDQLASHLQDLRVQGSPEARWILLALHHEPLGKSSPKEVENFKNLLFETEKKAWENGLVVESIEPYRGVKPPEGVAAPESPGYQFLCRPRTSEYILEKKVSIIILGFNQVAYTRKCIESIREHTRQNIELILVDNGSQDETAKYFQSIPGAIVKINSTNLGVARGWNQALRLATGDYLLLMNNDTVVTPHWLENMVRLAESHPDIGIVGPRSNNISGPQKAEGRFNNDDASIFKQSQEWQRRHDLSAFPFDRITGFCMLISRPAFEKIGLFDERFGKGNFEDDDYCMRARYLGYRLLIANDSFVFHYGSVSYRQESVDWQQLMMQNARKFKEKWEKGKSAVEDTQVQEERGSTGESDPGPAQIKSDRSPNEAGPEPIQTGGIPSGKLPPSTEDLVRGDGSLQAIMEDALGHYNQGRLEEAKQLFLKAVEKDPRCAEAYNGLGILSFHQDQYADALSLFRKALEINPNDEDAATNILDVIKKACEHQEAHKILNALLVDFPGNPVLKAELERVSPIPTREDETKWKERVENLIREKRYQEALDHIEPRIKSSRDLASCYNYMGIIAFECKDPRTAWEHFKRSLHYNLMDEDVLINYFDAGITLGKQEEVLSTFQNVFQDPGAGKKLAEIKHAYDQLQLSVQNHRLNPDELISSREKNLTGENLIREGMLDKAQEVFEEILKEEPDDFRANNNMGLLAWYHGNLDEAWTFFTRALTLHPTYTDALINSFDVALRRKDIDSYVPYLEKFLERDPQNAEAFNIKKNMETKGEAIYDVRTFDDIDPVNSKLAQAESDLHEGRYNQSILKFLDVLEENPQCFTAYNGLGVIAFNRKMYKEAFKLILLAVENNPLDATSLLNLWEVAKVLGVEAQVIGRLSSAVQIDPSMKEVKAVVEGYGG